MHRGAAFLYVLQKYFLKEAGLYVRIDEGKSVMSTKFKLGRVYQSKTHGEVKFMGRDEYLGVITLHFYSLDYGRDLYWKPEVLDRHLDILSGFPMACVDSIEPKYQAVQFEIAKLALKPNDILVVKFIAGGPRDDADAERFIKKIKDLLRIDAAVLCIEENIELSVIEKTGQV